MTDMRFIPSEVDLTGVYFPPLLVNGTLGVLMMLLTVYLLNRYRLSRYFFFPPLVMAALSAIYTVIFSLWVIPA